MQNVSNFGERLGELMDDGGLSHEALSRVAGCGRGCISGWLSGQYLPSLKNLIGLSLHFACSMDFLLGRSLDVGNGDFEFVSTFSQRLKALSKEVGKSLLKIAAELKIDNAILYRWARGVYQPSVPALIMLADYFSCTTDFLVGRR